MTRKEKINALEKIQNGHDTIDSLLPKKLILKMRRGSNETHKIITFSFFYGDKPISAKQFEKLSQDGKHVIERRTD